MSPVRCPWRRPDPSASPARAGRPSAGTSRRGGGMPARRRAGRIGPARDRPLPLSFGRHGCDQIHERTRNVPEATAPVHGAQAAGGGRFSGNPRRANLVDCDADAAAGEHPRSGWASPGGAVAAGAAGAGGGARPAGGLRAAPAGAGAGAGPSGAARSLAAAGRSLAGAARGSAPGQRRWDALRPAGPFGAVAPGGGGGGLALAGLSTRSSKPVSYSGRALRSTPQEHAPAYIAPPIFSRPTLPHAPPRGAG